MKKLTRNQTKVLAALMLGVRQEHLAQSTGLGSAAMGTALTGLRERGFLAKTRTPRLMRAWLDLMDAIHEVDVRNPDHKGIGR